MSFPVTDHCNGKTFFNPGVRAERGWREVLRWKLTSRATPWPARVGLAPQPAPPPPRGDEIAATWIGHATFLLQTAAGNFLTDPVFSERASPVRWAGPRRVHAPGVAFDRLPRIDTVLLSHDHFDHCDLPSLRSLAQRHRARVIAPLGHGPLLAAAGFKDIVELDWWHTRELSTDHQVTLTPAQHWCRRTVGGTNRRLWGGFFLRLAGRRVYFAGDTGYDDSLFRRIGERCGAPDLAMIPIGAYEPRWFMRSAHLNPAEAVRVHQAVGSRLSLAMHWGCWQLTDEGRDEPVRELEEARHQSGIGGEHFRALAPGESVVV